MSRKEYKDVHVNTFALDGKSTVVLSRYVCNLKFADIPLLPYLDTGHMMLVLLVSFPIHVCVCQFKMECLVTPFKFSSKWLMLGSVLKICLTLTV